MGNTENIRRIHENDAIFVPIAADLNEFRLKWTILRIAAQCFLQKRCKVASTKAENGARKRSDSGIVRQQALFSGAMQKCIEALWPTD